MSSFSNESQTTKLELASILGSDADKYTMQPFGTFGSFETFERSKRSITENDSNDPNNPNDSSGNNDDRCSPEGCLLSTGFEHGDLKLVPAG